jgi:hypothetical protein
MADPNLLLVEGPDDRHVFYRICEHYQLPQQFRIQEAEGVNNILETLPVRLKAGGLDRLGLVLDADTDVTRRWQALHNILTRAGYSVPAVPESSGTVLHQPNRPDVGIWLMPDNASPAPSKILSALWYRQMTRSGCEQPPASSRSQRVSGAFAPNITAKPSFIPGWPGKKTLAHHSARLSQNVTSTPAYPRSRQ